MVATGGEQDRGDGCGGEDDRRDGGGDGAGLAGTR
jgi:hypothetical protein